MKLRWAAAVVGAGIASVAAWQLIAFDRAAWKADFAQLVDHTSAVYANLEWVKDHRKLDLKALHDETLQALDAAHTDWQARAAIVRFVERFDDPHFEVRREKLSKKLARWWKGTPPPQAASDLCAGFPEEPVAFRFPLPPGSEELVTSHLAGQSFPAAVLPGRVGLVRIHSFSSERFGGACIAARRQSEDTPDAGVDFRNVAVPNAILAGLASRVEQLQHRGVQTLVIDLTHNGGGTDWVDAATRTLTAAPVECPRRAFIRHRHYQKRFEERRAELGPALERDGSAAALALLGKLDRAIAETKDPCDRRPLFDGKDAGCAQLGSEPFYACGLVPYLPPDALPGVRADVWHAAGYTFAPGVWTGPLVVLVDGSTASAAEEMAAVLQDAKAAVIVGEKTLGAGCGYTGGGVPAVLKHSGLVVMMPDCARFRANGDNEIEGVAPDVPLSDFGGGLLEALSAAAKRR